MKQLPTCCICCIVADYNGCDDVPTSEGSGVYMIKLRGVLKPVFCEIQNDSKYLVSCGVSCVVSIRNVAIPI